jgi:hypothetical protein
MRYVILCLLYLLLPTVSMAQVQTDTFYERGGVVGYCNTAPGPRSAIFLERLVNCFAQAPDGAVYQFTEEMLSMLEPVYMPIIAATLLLAITIHGYKITAGLTNSLGRDTFVLLIKIGGVLYLIYNFRFFHEAVIFISYNFADMVTNVMGDLGDVCDDDFPGHPSIWHKFDCMYEFFFGINSNNVVMGSIAVFFGFLFQGGLGTAIFFAYVYFMIMILLAGLRAVYVFIMAVITLSFCVVLAPFLVPTIFFASSFQYFSRYAKLVLSYMIQPMLLFAVMSMLLIVVEFMVFQGPASLYAKLSHDTVNPDTANYTTSVWPNYGNEYWIADVTGVAGSDPNARDNATSVLGFFNTMQMGPNPDVYAYTTEDAERCAEAAENEQYQVACGNSELDRGSEEVNQVTGTMSQLAKLTAVFQTLDFETLATQLGFDAADAGPYLADLLSSLIACCVMAYVMYVMVQAVPRISADLIAHEYKFGNISEAQMLGEPMLKKTLATTQASANKAGGMGNMVGNLFK